MVQNEVKEAMETGKLVGIYMIHGNRIQDISTLKVANNIRFICGPGHYRICGFYYRVYTDMNDSDKTFTSFEDVNIPESTPDNRAHTTLYVGPVGLTIYEDPKKYQTNEIIIKPNCKVADIEANAKLIVSVTLKIYKLNRSEEVPTKEETTMKPEMKEKMEHGRKVCTYVFNHIYGIAVKADMCLVHSNYNLALKTGHEYLAHAKFYNNGQVVKEDICEFKNIKLYPDATINFTLKIDGSKNKINIDINPGTKDYSILDIIEECEGLDATIDVYDCTPKAEEDSLNATIDLYDCTTQTEEDSKETTSDKDEKPNFTSEVDPQLRDKEYQAALMAELFKQRLSSLGLSIVNKDGSTVDIDECLSTDEPWKTFQPTGVHYMHDGSLNAYGIYDVDDEGIEDLNDRIRKMICDIKDVERLVKRIRTENEDLIDKLAELKTTTTYPHILDVSNHCFNTADDIMVRVELREKVSHITYTVGTVYFRKDDQYGYRMIFGEDGQYEMKVIDEDFLKDHPMIPGLHSLYVDTDQIPKQMRENLEMVVSELVDRHIHPYSNDFIECLNVTQGWLREAHKNLKGSKRARKQIIKALKD
mgnify:FL=1